MAETRDIIYRATPTLAAFHQCDAKVRGVMGPVGSGKSTAMSMELVRRAREQAPGQDKVRRTRWAVVRNTYGELRDTTLKTFCDWFPPGVFGRFVEHSMTYHFQMREADGTTVEAELLFRALDRPDHVRKLLSLELTGAWVNEAREIAKGILDALDDRVGRYPALKDGGPTWHGVILDTNPPDTDHWWYRLAEVERPEGWAFFRQPGGLVEKEGRFLSNPEAENIAVFGSKGELLQPGVAPNYYTSRVAGKGLDHIRIYYCAQYGFVVDGRPVVPEYRDSVHTAREILEPTPGLPLVLGLDFGLTPAALIAQPQVNGQVRWIDELVSEDMGAQRFGELLKKLLATRYAGFPLDVWGDPAGAQRAQTDEKTCFQILHALGIPVKPARTNEFTLRREALAAPCRRLIDGEPGLLVSPRCVWARKAMMGGYCFRRLKVSSERFADAPDKNMYSHIADAAQYAHLGAGEGASLVRNQARDNAPRQLVADYSFTFSADRNRAAGLGHRQAVAD